MAFPADRRYTREHEWIKAEGNQATIGITDYAQSSLGDIVFVELPKIGDEIGAGKNFGSVESVKAVSEVYAPASGKVVAVNEELATAPEKINSDAHGAWFIRIDVKDAAEIEKLLSAEDYETYVKEEGGH
jgi:glycine cleavage system H protein